MIDDEPEAPGRSKGAKLYGRTPCARRAAANLNVIDARKVVEPMRQITIPASVVPSLAESGRLQSRKWSHGSEGGVTVWTKRDRWRSR